MPSTESVEKTKQGLCGWRLDSSCRALLLQSCCSLVAVYCFAEYYIKTDHRVASWQFILEYCADARQIKQIQSKPQHTATFCNTAHRVDLLDYLLGYGALVSQTKRIQSKLQRTATLCNTLKQPELIQSNAHLTYSTPVNRKWIKDQKEE